VKQVNNDLTMPLEKKDELGNLLQQRDTMSRELAQVDERIAELQQTSAAKMQQSTAGQYAMAARPRRIDGAELSKDVAKLLGPQRLGFSDIQQLRPYFESDEKLAVLRENIERWREHCCPKLTTDAILAELKAALQKDSSELAEVA
jgi:hypothetical protein